MVLQRSPVPTSVPGVSLRGDRPRKRTSCTSSSIPWQTRRRARRSGAVGRTRGESAVSPTRAKSRASTHGEGDVSTGDGQVCNHLAERDHHDVAHQTDRGVAVESEANTSTGAVAAGVEGSRLTMSRRGESSASAGERDERKESGTNPMSRPAGPPSRSALATPKKRPVPCHHRRQGNQ